MTNHSLSLNDFDSICRICLTSKENMITYSTPQIIHMIEECTSIQEPHNTKLPHQICNNCYWQLKNSYQFKQQYVLSVEILCEILLSSEKWDKYSEESQIIISIRDKLRKTSNCGKTSNNPTDESNDLTVQEVNLTKENEFMIKTEFHESDDSDYKAENVNSLSPDITKKQENMGNKYSDYLADKRNENSPVKRETNSSSDDENTLNENCYNESENYNDQTQENETNSDEEREDTENGEQTRRKLAELLIKKYEIYDLTCNICKKELSTRATLLRHMETHNTNRKFKHRCHVCNKGFYDRGNLNKHLNRHEGKANYKCDLCSKRYYELSALAVHIKDKHKVAPVSCEKCSMQFYHPLQLQQHEQTHEQREEVVCDVCGKVFKTKANLKDHQMIHMNVRPHVCKICNKAFRKKFTLTTHIKMRHEDSIQRTMCFKCGKLFVGRLAKHLESHEKKTKCKHCNQMFPTRAVLRAHIKEQHIVKKRFTCEVCNKSLGSKSILRKHMKCVHSGIREFTCTVCAKAFAYREVLKTHMKIHSK